MTIPDDRKKRVEEKINSLVKAARTGARHIPVGGLSKSEVQYGLEYGKAHSIKTENLQGIGKCFFFPA